MHHIPNGDVYILFEDGEDTRQVQRGFAEDLSLGPKHIFVLPFGMERSPWNLEHVGKHVNLKADSIPTGTVNTGGDITGPFAFFIPAMAYSLGWVLERRSSDPGDNRVTITTRDGKLAWTYTDRKVPNGNVVELRDKTYSREQTFRISLDKGYAEYLSRGTRKDGYKDEERAQKSGFGYNRKGHGRGFCE
ncbi:hypothetical protein TWF730_008287 [Orbilia blumenaviensis]|uniref:Uncharacterized protein n=1 Tax=Orbilia blumenaviensis TaxID=1796055 RepID=A0AAV9V2Q9_9PEZI